MDRWPVMNIRELPLSASSSTRGATWVPLARLAYAAQLVEPTWPWRSRSSTCGDQGAQRVIVTVFMWIGVRGLSLASVGTCVIAVTTLTGSQAPKMV